MARDYEKEVRDIIESGGSAHAIAAAFERLNAYRDLRKAQRDFVEAAGALDRAWSRAERATGTALLEDGYPEYLPSFEMFVSELIDWRDTEKP